MENKNKCNLLLKYKKYFKFEIYTYDNQTKLKFKIFLYFYKFIIRK